MPLVCDHFSLKNGIDWLGNLQIIMIYSTSFISKKELVIIVLAILVLFLGLYFDQTFFFRFMYRRANKKGCTGLCKEMTLCRLKKAWAGASKNC